MTKNFLFPVFKSYITAIILFTIFFTTFAFGGERRSISAPIANVRSGPGDNHKILWKLEKYHPIQITESSGEWYQFTDFEGDKGWIHKSVISDVPSVIIKKDNCNVRSGPGENNKTIFRVGRGVPFKVLERKGKWIYIQHSDGDKGWISESLVW